MRTHLQEAFLLVEGECVEAHGADEGDPGGEDVEHVLALADPQPLQLGERREGAEVLQVQHLHVGQPQLKSQFISICYLFGSRLVPLSLSLILILNLRFQTIAQYQARKLKLKGICCSGCTMFFGTLDSIFVLTYWAILKPILNLIKDTASD